MKHDFNLIPFGDRPSPEIEIVGFISRNRDRLDIQYQLRANLSKIIIPQPTPTPSRQYDLWEHTCFELFLRPKNTTKYWEFNLSPAGDWNVFHLTDYRQNMREETAIVALPFEVFPTTKFLQLTSNFDLSSIIKPEQNIDVAITTVVENKERELSYWALTHKAIAPDFHHPDSFILSL